MPVEVCYINRNSVPVGIPHRRGGIVLFKPGDRSFDPWFGRFCGSGKLSAEKMRTKGSPAPDAATPPAFTTPTMTPLVKALADESTLFWERKKGIYRCKRCEVFRSGSRQMMIEHLIEVHDVPEKELKPPNELTSRTMSSMAATAQLPVEKETVVIAAPPPPAETLPPPPPPAPSTPPPPVEAPAPAQKVFTCTIPGCNKQFGSERGLSSHMTRMHKSQ